MWGVVDLVYNNRGKFFDFFSIMVKDKVSRKGFFNSIRIFCNKIIN